MKRPKGRIMDGNGDNHAMGQRHVAPDDGGATRSRGAGKLLAAALLMAAVLVPWGMAQAQETLVSNLSQAYAKVDSGATRLIVTKKVPSRKDKDRLRAIRFRTGTSSGGMGFRLTAVKVAVIGYRDDSAPLVTIAGATSRVKPDDRRATLCTATNPSNLPDSDPPDDGRDGDVDILNEVHLSTYSFSNCLLDDDTHYFVVFAETVEDSAYKLHTTRRNEEDYSKNGMGRADWFIGNTTFWRRSSQRAGWRAGNDQKMRLAIEGEEEVPAPVIPPNSAARGRPRISGTPQVGGTLTANKNPIRDANGLPSTFNYQWISVSEEDGRYDIFEATERTYTLGPRDIRRQVEVRVSFTDDDGYREAVTSQVYPATGHVLAPPLSCGHVHWCALLTVGKDGDLYGYEEGFYGSLTNTVFTHGEDYEVVEFAFYDEDLTVNMGEEPPDGTVFYVDGVKFEVDGNAGSDGVVAWNAPRGFGWVDGQRVRVTARFPNLPAEGKPAIQGTARVGRRLTANLGSVTDPDGLEDRVASGEYYSLLYQWMRQQGTTELSLGLGRNYWPRSYDAGKDIWVRLHVWDDEGHYEGTFDSNPVRVQPAM